MDFIFCIPIMFGCTTKIQPDGDQQPRVCPRCHNASVFSAKSRNWFELCFVPLIPMNSKRIWMCSICQWSVPLQQGWEPPVAGFQQPLGQQPFMQQGQYPPQGPYSPQGQPAYQPTYLNQQK